MTRFVYTAQHNLFPTPIWEFVLEDVSIADKFAQKFIQLRETEEDKGIHSGGGNWVSPDDLHLREDWNPITEIFLSRVKEVVDHLGIIYEDLEITCMWGNSHVGTSQHQMHHHPNSMFSGVFYLSAPENCGNLIIKDPRGALPTTFVFDYKEGYNFFEINKIVPSAGKIIIFPSWLEHGTDVGSHEGERISLSFNVVLKTKVAKRSIKWRYYE